MLLFPCFSGISTQRGLLYLLLLQHRYILETCLTRKYCFCHPSSGCCSSTFLRALNTNAIHPSHDVHLRKLNVGILGSCLQKLSAHNKQILFTLFCSQTPPCQCSHKHRLPGHVLPRVPLFSIATLPVSSFCIPFTPSSPSSPPTHPLSSHLSTLPAPRSLPLISPHPTFNQSCSIPPTTSQPKPTPSTLSLTVCPSNIWGLHSICQISQSKLQVTAQTWNVQQNPFSHRMSLTLSMPIRVVNKLLSACG